ncbi:MAG: hypothetical protein CMJ58_05805 [Planctomycetaceae bacterium]|nr:hypothetical protein [Planctomycetaceae bacterium]
MYFGMHLVRQGLLTTDDFFALLEQQVASRPPMGALAIETGKLTMKQVFEVLEAQCEETSQMFGEAAVRLGFLSEQDLAVLIYEQARRAMSMTELLVLNGHAEPETAEHWLQQYRDHQGRVTQMTTKSVAEDAASAAVS